MRFDPRRSFTEISFPRLAVIVFVVMVSLNYYPVFLGRIPLPRDLVIQFSPWSSYPKPPDVQRVADIGDLVTAFYPFRALAARSVRQGTLPLWDPNLMSGTAFLGNAQSSMFYPPNLLLYILPLPAAWTSLIMLRMFLAGLFMTLLVRSVGGSKTGSLLSGIIFASCGFLTGWQGQPMGDAVIWLPMICYVVYRLHTRPRPFWIGITALAFAMPVLAGHPETATHLTLAGIITAFVLWSWPYEGNDRGLDLRFLLSFTAAGILALGVASIQMLPTVEWIGQLGDTLQGTWPTWHPHEIYGLVSRDVLGSPNSAGLAMPEAAAYVGMITLLAAALAPFHRARKAVFLFGLLMFLGGSVAYSIKPVSSLVAYIPVLKAIKNERLILAVMFGLAGLAGLGISAIEQERIQSARQKRWALMLLSAAFLSSVLLVERLHKDTRVQVEFMRQPSFSALLLVLSAIPILWRLRGGLQGRAFPIIICTVACFDLITFGHGFTGFTYARDVFPPSPVFDFLMKNAPPGKYRVASVGPSYPGNSTLMYGLASADGYDGAPQRMRLFTSDLGDQSAFIISFSERGVVKAKDRRFDLLNVKYIVATPYSPDFALLARRPDFVRAFDAGVSVVYENKSVLPRAFAVPVTGIELLSDYPAQLARLRDASFNPEQSVILSSKPAPMQVGAVLPNNAPFESHVEITESDVNEVRMHSRVSQAAILVVSQTYFPGWKATVDGNGVDLVPANLALTGLPVPAGDHEIRLVYSPMSFKIGAGITIVSLLIVAGLMMLKQSWLGKRERDVVNDLVEDEFIA